MRVNNQLPSINATLMSHAPLLRLVENCAQWSTAKIARRAKFDFPGAIESRSSRHACLSMAKHQAYLSLPFLSVSFNTHTHTRENDCVKQGASSHLFSVFFLLLPSKNIARKGTESSVVHPSLVHASHCKQGKEENNMARCAHTFHPISIHELREQTHLFLVYILSCRDAVNLLSLSLSSSPIDTGEHERSGWRDNLIGTLQRSLLVDSTHGSTSRCQHSIPTCAQLLPKTSWFDPTDTRSHRNRSSMPSRQRSANSRCGSNDNGGAEPDSWSRRDSSWSRTSHSWLCFARRSARCTRYVVVLRSNG